MNPLLHLSSRHALLRRIMLVFPFFVLSSCTRAPLQEVLGSFFPSWMLCAALGAVAAAGLRAMLGALGMQNMVTLPMPTYLAFTIAVTFTVWLVFFGH